VRNKHFIKIVFGLALIASGCSKLLPAKGTVAPTPVYAISITGGNSQTASAGSQLPHALVATVVDTTSGNVASDIQVDWTVVSGGGSFANENSSTDKNGQVPTDYVLGAVAGPNTVTATVHGTSTLVTFGLTGTVGPVSANNSSITGTSPIEPDGINFSTITITLIDGSSNPVTGITPTFTATGSGNIYGACSATNISGISNCTLKSTVGETKILTITSPVNKIGGTVAFVTSTVSASNSSISGTTPVTANGTSTSTITVTLKDSSNAPVGSLVPTFAATDTASGNAYAVCSSSSNVTGISTCTMTSTYAENKTLSLTSPVSVTGNVIAFNPGPASSVHSTITGTTPVEPNGTSTSAITITLKDASGNPISGTTPVFAASGSSNTLGACSSTNASGISTCTLSSTVAETKTLTLTSPLSLTGGTVVFAPGTVSALHSSITGTSTVVADGTSTSTITITLKDASNVGVGGIVPIFSATDTGATNVYGTCTSSIASTGISTCTLTSTKAETKTLSLTSPISLSGGTVVFVPGAISATTSTITGTTPIVADGSTQSTITITLLDAHQNGVPGTTPLFSATDTGTHNSQGACSVSNSVGVSTCTLASTKAEVKNLSITSPVTVVQSAVTFTHGPASISTSSITGSSPVEPDGVSNSTITIDLLDQFSNPVNATTPTFTATNTGNTNVIGTCSASNAAGTSICTLASSHAETKTLSMTAPISMTGGTVTFAAGSASATYSTITGTSSITANGVTTSTVTIVLKDSGNLPITGQTPTFTATNTSNGNTYGACSATDSTGTSTCSLASTRAETKTLQLASPITFSGGTVTFIHGPVSATTSQITGTGPVLANGTATATVTIVLYDAYNNPISGTVPTFTATNTGGGNIYQACSSSSATGASTCTMKSTVAETKTLSISSPVVVSGGTVVFTGGTVSASTSTITGMTNVIANGTATSTITITLLDATSNPVAGTAPTFTATDTGSTNFYGGCSISNASGVSTCVLKSTKAEVKTLSIATPVVASGGMVTFIGGTAVAGTSSITGTSPVVADGTSTSTITITLKDSYGNATSGTVPTFSATDGGSNNVYGVCSSSSASGISTCTLKSGKAETKTLSVTSPFSLSGGTVTFTAAASPSNSTIVGTGPVLANGVATSTVTITLKDYSNVGISGIVPTFTATDSGSTNVYTACSTTTAGGVSTCTLKSTHGETKTLSLATPIVFAGGTVTFTQVVSAANTTLTGTGPVTADGTSTSTVSITLLDYSNSPVVGTVPTFTATNTGTTNVYGACSSSNASGISTCTLASSKGETKTLTLVTPVAKTGGTVVFTQVPSATYSTISGAGPVIANGAATSTVTITLKDSTNTAIVGVIPTFTATNTGSGNAYAACSATLGTGVSTCTFTSTKAETKTLSLVTPIVLTGNTVVFTQATSATASTITGSGPVNADGSSTSTVTITLLDYSNAPVVGTTPTFTATNTGTTNVYGSCSSSNASGVSTCTLASSKAETKTLSIATPVAKAGGTVIFSSVVDSANSSITGGASVIANGTATSTVTITLKDYSNVGVGGITPTFTATDTGSLNAYGSCTVSTGGGVSTCTFTSRQAEVKTLSIATPIALAGGTVTFTQAASPSYSTITGSGPVGADGASSSTVTITLKDYANAAMVGVNPSFTATNTGTTNVYGACSSTNGSGVSTCTLKSTKAETKTLTLATPISMAGGTVIFTQVASATNSAIIGTSPVTANGTSASTITITIKDYAAVAIQGVIPTFTATNTLGGNIYGTCSSTTAGGVSTCTLKSTHAETKTLSGATPVVFTGGTVVFQ
jgi:adhesin/invasin